MTCLALETQGNSFGAVNKTGKCSVTPMNREEPR